MTHPVLWPNKIFFYPLGNTPAVCFTSELSPERPADVLLLGCGDARSILYTVYADLGGSPRNLDFTCCDWEPATLARNVLLYTLIADSPSGDDADAYISKIWNLYYHFFIDKATLDFLLKQCQRLLDCSADLSGWNSSAYGTFLRFCTAHTLHELRRHWKLYIKTETFSNAQKDALREKFQRSSSSNDKEKTPSGTSIRSAGPLLAELGDLGLRQFDRYWETGVTFDDPDEVAAANLVNPTFAYSAMGLGFELHYGSDPLLSFHLSKALGPVKGSTTGEAPTISSLVKYATYEFNAWCRSFNKRLRMQHPHLVIRLFVGDAIAFCRALRSCSTNNTVDTGVYTTSWSSKLINLDGGDYGDDARHRAPLQFNVVDTSNLADHLGLLNILIACRPLVRKTPSSVLHTNTLLRSNEEGIARSGFLELLCGDISIFSMILDMIPVSYVSNFTSHSNVHEIALGTSSTGQFHEQVSWRVASMSDSEVLPLLAHREQHLNFDEKQLAIFFYNVYLKMFRTEDVGAMFQSSLSLWNLAKLSRAHYVRFSFAYLLRLAKDKVNIDWKAFMDHLCGLVYGDKRLLVGANNVQDLLCAFHILDLYSAEPFSAGFNDSSGSDGILKGWEDIPPVVSITLQVPRGKFKPLEDLNGPGLGTLSLLCAVAGTGFHNSFQSYQSFFGRVVADYHDRTAKEPSITFHEDAAGLRGSSSVIFVFYVPTWLLGLGPSLRVEVSLRVTPAVSATFMPIFGPSLVIFSALITDREHVHITRERPGNYGELHKLRCIQSGTQLSFDTVKINLEGADKQVLTLTGRVDIVDGGAKTALTDGAAVKVRHVSSQAIEVSFGKHTQVIPYPFPVDSSTSKTRIARKSSYIEVDVKAFNPGQRLGAPLKPFPILRHDGLLNLWNIHYVDLDRLPALDLSSVNRLNFVSVHVAMAFSDRERRLCEAERKGSSPGLELDVITRMKQTIYHLFSNIQGSQHRIYGLSDPNNGGTYTLIFVNDLVLDLASHTIVVDAVVLPLTGSLVESLSRAIWQINEAGIMQIQTDPDEVKLWKHLLPAFTERCRKWKHGAQCEYISRGVPVSEEMEESPICSCGKGRNLGPFAANKGWKPFAPHCTRIAISPLFAVPFVDTIGELIPERFGVLDMDACAKCGGPGKPKLLLCGACKERHYCSAECQKTDWKAHKKQCKRS